MKNFTQPFYGFTSILLVAIIANCTSVSQSKETKTSEPIITSSNSRQTETTLSEADKKQIVIEILKKENLRDSEERDKNKQSKIYILNDYFPVKQIPEIKGIEILFIKQEEIEAKKKSEIVYYEFRDFKVDETKVVLPIIWNKRDSSSGHSAVIEYECQKLSDKWNVEGKVVGVAVGENH